MLMAWLKSSKAVSGSPMRRCAMQVLWDSNKCCHAGVCVKSLPEVFKAEDGQFVIDPSKASDEEVISVVSQCPSGALEIVD
jgi:uncharacterized Fe-S cluster protein YjdI